MGLLRARVVEQGDSRRCGIAPIERFGASVTAVLRTIALLVSVPPACPPSSGTVRTLRSYKPPRFKLLAMLALRSRIAYVRAAMARPGNLNASRTSIVRDAALCRYAVSLFGQCRYKAPAGSCRDPARQVPIAKKEQSRGLRCRMAQYPGRAFQCPIPAAIGHGPQHTRFLRSEARIPVPGSTSSTVSDRTEDVCWFYRSPG